MRAAYKVATRSAPEVIDFAREDLNMPRFASREEYESWKRAAGSPPEAGTPEVPSPPAAAPAVPAKPKTGFKETFSGMPGWGWVFVVGCLALPVVNLGGAIPGALGFGGAAACANVAKKPEWDVAPRVLVCTLIAGGVWAAFFGIAVAIALLRQ